MGEKNKKKNGDQQKEGAENKKKDNGGGGGGGKNNVTTVVLKADLHCEGCVYKVLKCIRSFEGVGSADIGDGQRITVVGKVDPAELRQRVEQKTHKKVELVSPPQPKKEDNSKNGSNKDSAKGKENSGRDNAANQIQEKKEEDKNSKTNSDKKKSKDKKESTVVTTAVLKVHLHCEGCIQKIFKIVTKMKGYQDMKLDKEKELVTVTGAMDMTALALVLKKHLKKDVQILPPPKKEVEKKEKTGVKEAGGEKLKSSGDKGGDMGKSSGDKGGDMGKSGSNKGRSGGGDGGEMAGGGQKMEGNKMQLQAGDPYPYTNGPGFVERFHYYNPYGFGPYPAPAPAPQMFSDENPNACSVM